MKQLVESGSIIDEQKKQQLEYLLRVKKWNPYCFRHSAITDDSDHLSDRYIKNGYGDDLKNKILEHSGIKIANKQSQMVSRTCGRCDLTM